MNWFRQNRYLGTFLIVFGGATLLALVFLWWSSNRYDAAAARYQENAQEANRLERTTPFPNESNLVKMKAQAQEYAAAVTKLKEDLKAHVLPLTPMAPNEFQSKLNQTRTALTAKAAVNKVKLPENFFLGFEEYGGSLPDTAAAPLLGQELAQVELLLNILIDAHVDEIVSLKRVRATPAATPTPTTGRKPPGPAAKNATTAPVIERNVIDLAFNASPSSERRALNQIASADPQFYIVRTLHVLNDKEKGPPKAAVGTGAPAPATPAANSALNFIVGNEHLRNAARIEMVRFNF